MKAGFILGFLFFVLVFFLPYIKQNVLGYICANLVFKHRRPKVKADLLQRNIGYFTMDYPRKGMLQK